MEFVDAFGEGVDLVYIGDPVEYYRVLRLLAVWGPIGTKLLVGEKVVLEEGVEGACGAGVCGRPATCILISCRINVTVDILS
jgi:hypothetical protein